MKGELAVVASQYAEATLELAVEADQAAPSAGSPIAERVAADLQGITEVFSAAPDLTLILNHPAVGPEEKKKLLLDTFTGKVHELTARLLHLLADRRRLEIVEAVRDRYQELLRVRQNIVSARLICSETLDAKAIADIKARLTEHLGKRLELEVDIDPSLLGGVVLKIGDQVVDGSLRGKLQEIEKELCSV